MTYTGYLDDISEMLGLTNPAEYELGTEFIDSEGAQWKIVGLPLDLGSAGWGYEVQRVGGLGITYVTKAYIDNSALVGAQTLKERTCTCDSQDLFNYGCKCGYLKGDKK